MIKLETLLASAKPESKGSKTPPELVAQYFDAHGVRRDLANSLPGMTTDVRKLAGSWNTIPLLIGLLYRMNEDGLDVLTQLGMSADDIASFRRTCRVVRELCSAYGVTASTPTKILYDNVKQLGF